MDIDLIKARDKSPKYYQYYPRLFHPYFYTIDAQLTDKLSKAGYLYYQSVLFTDSLIDEGDLSKIPLIQIYQEETIKILCSIYNSENILWEYWSKRRNEYFEAVKIERSLKIDSDVDLTVYEDLSDKKAAFGKVAIDCLYAIENENNSALYKSLLESHYHFSVGFQLYDDIKDFKEDLLKKQFNWAIYELSKVLKFDHYKNDVTLLNKLLYLRGVGQSILSKSIASFKKSISILEKLNIESEWLQINIEMKDTIENYLDVTNGYIKTLEKKIEIKTAEHPENGFFDYKEVLDATIKKGLQYIELDYTENFAELKHYMYLSNSDGFRNPSQIHFSDTFQRAMLNDCLMEVAKKYSLNAKTFLESECDYLINRINNETGGWSYFPTVKEIAADIDDLGQMIQLFLGCNRKDLAEKFCLKPIQLALENRIHPNGGIETWIIPKNNQIDLQKTQEYFNSAKWGKGPDVEVVANFVYALKILQENNYRQHIANAVTYVLSNQKENGSWESRWYYGNYYGTYVCLRLLKEFNGKYVEQINRSLDFILMTQNEDGGFSMSGEHNSDPLNTSFALLSLKLFFSENNTSIKNAENYLVRSQSELGYWKDIDFIKPKVQEPYKSKTITTAFVLKSLC